MAKTEFSCNRCGDSYVFAEVPVTDPSYCPSCGHKSGSDRTIKHTRLRDVLREEAVAHVEDIDVDGIKVEVSE